MRASEHVSERVSMHAWACVCVVRVYMRACTRMRADMNEKTDCKRARISVQPHSPPLPCDPLLFSCVDLCILQRQRVAYVKAFAHSKEGAGSSFERASRSQRVVYRRERATWSDIDSSRSSFVGRGCDDSSRCSFTARCCCFAFDVDATTSSASP